MWLVIFCKTTWFPIFSKIIVELFPMTQQKLDSWTPGDFKAGNEFLKTDCGKLQWFYSLLSLRNRFLRNMCSLRYMYQFLLFINWSFYFSIHTKWGKIFSQCIIEVDAKQICSIWKYPFWAKTWYNMLCMLYFIYSFSTTFTLFAL